MTVVLRSIRKVAVIAWSTDEVKGTDASLNVEGADGELVEKRDVKNDGESNLFFPQSYTGTCTVTVKGSHSGEETGTISIS